MREFSNIFADKFNTWRLRRNSETNLVDGIYGDGNNIFKSIINSINTSVIIQGQLLILVYLRMP